ncbi:hypothetical protein A1O3_04457 [Capronia epimyces CBS 606.96]|uniref:Methyltransferase type 11 domain-containing protein n=1 Tax=Capronia epimyces CBS 606.96 TaxID=1182542 RepID=W9Y3V9_9EURO|nr:uncharacterized protein A1O3_04457 [Capronia epimyces CBS 606.96]EXJ87497.1 hypothetical protein A1O3_04457 [Capronia epimyces CBS 606.96]
MTSIPTSTSTPSAPASAPPTSPPPTVYTQGHSASVLASHLSRTVENSASFLLPHLKPGFTVVDLGCGPGTITRGFCAHVPGGKVIGIDASAEVIERARSLLSASAEMEQDATLNSANEDATLKSANQDPASLEFLVADVTARLPFPDASVDVVYTHQTLLHIPAAERVVQEAYRILRPEGMLAMREALAITFLPANAGTLAYAEGLDKAVRDTGASGFQAGRTLHLWALRAGFDRAKMQVGAGASCYAGPGGDAKWWADLHAERLDGDVGARWRDSGVVDDQRAIEDMKAGLAAWGGCDDAWASVMQGEVICWK